MQEDDPHQWLDVLRECVKLTSGVNVVFRRQVVFLRVGGAAHVFLFLLPLGGRELLLVVRWFGILHHVLLMGVLDNWRFCPRCRGELNRVEDHLTCATCGERYWANAIPGVQGILERDGRVLLARRAHEPRRGHWDLPGGFLDETEDPADGLRREFREETGLEVEPVELLRIDIEPYDGRHVFSVTLLVRGEGEPVAADDVDELRWFARDELPEEMAFPGQEKVLRAWAARQQDA
jgi:ADP-ribose pyrophosphatase YjhB (NUDIX family)